jgi:hypothetical protein
MENSITTFKASIILKLYNLLFVIAICIVISFFQKNASFHGTYIFLILVLSMYFLYVFASKNLNSINVDKNTHIVNFNFTRFFFYKTTLTLPTTDFYFSYKEEVRGRGTKSLVFTLYDLDEEIIIKIAGLMDGWNGAKIGSMFFLFKELEVKELI